MTHLSVRPAATRGVHQSGSARVVAGGGVVVVVTSNKRKAFHLVGADPITSPNPNKWQIATEDGELTVVAAGGCLCGKPWMKKPSDSELLAWGEGSLAVEEVSV
jgi:hypothetical protein